MLVGSFQMVIFLKKQQDKIMLLSYFVKAVKQIKII